MDFQLILGLKDIFLVSMNNNLNKGTVTLSFDCEAKWGMADKNYDWLDLLNQKNIMNSYNYILSVLEEFQIPSTFAFVGAMTESKRKFEENIDFLMSNESHKKWIKPILKKIETEEGWFFPDILELFDNAIKHEIASHGYTHIPFTFMKRNEAELELKMISEWSSRMKIDCKTFIFPRNLMAHNDLLINYGINLFRDYPKDFKNKIFPSSINNFVEELNILKSSEIFIEGDNRLPGGVFINWQNGKRKLIPMKISLKKYKNIINHAIKNNQVAHFWIHPHNFISSPQTKFLFEGLCRDIANQRDMGLININRQVDFL